VRKRDGEVRAVSSRCRHQLADLSKGSLDKVRLPRAARGTARATTWTAAPWSRARRACSGTRAGRPGYTQLVKAYSQVLKLRRRKVVQQGDAYVVQE
jgi:hypothetical protein